MCDPLEVDTNWHQARTVCQEQGSQLLHMETEKQFDEIKKWIITLFLTSAEETESPFFINYHQFAFNSSWDWGSGPRQRSFHPTFHRSETTCSDINCGRFHMAGNGKSLVFSDTLCDEHWMAHTICKRSRCCLADFVWDTLQTHYPIGLCFSYGNHTLF